VCESTTVFILSKRLIVVVPPKNDSARSMHRTNEPNAWLTVNSM